MLPSLWLTQHLVLIKELELVLLDQRSCEGHPAFVSLRGFNHRFFGGRVGLAEDLVLWRGFGLLCLVKVILIGTVRLS